MKILELQFFPGRNIYSHRPVLKMLLDLGKWSDFRTDKDPYFTERLLKALPGLCGHHCSRRRPGGFVERLREGTYLGHVVEHILLEMQNLAGLGTEYGKTMGVSETIVQIVCEYRCRQASQILAQAAVDTVLSLLGGECAVPQGALAEAKKLAAEYLPGPSTSAILAAARRRGIPILPLADGTSLYLLGNGKYQKRIMASIDDATGCIAVDIACDKQLTKKMLAEHGLPVPCGEVVRCASEAVAAAERLCYPVVMKPVNGNQGKGVSLNVKTAKEARKAFARAAAYCSQVIVEKFLPGRHYRLLVVGGRLVAASERIPAHVYGNGIATLRELVALANLDPLRGEGHERPLTRIVIDEIVESVLQKQGLTPDDVPAAGRRVWLRENANLSTGGSAVDVTDIVHPMQAEMAVMAARIIGLNIAGVDVVMPDISLPPSGQGGGIIEVNASPGLRMHLFPSTGQRRDVGRAIVEMLFPPGKPYRVPVFSVTGTNGKTTTVRMLEFALRCCGLVTGMSCTDGIYINGAKVQAGDLSGPTGARVVLGHPAIEAAVLETARGGLVRWGLGYDRADVAVITNIRADHLGQDGIETLDDLAHVKSLVAEAVYSTGAVVLNADDPYACELAQRVWAEIIYTSLQNENIVVRRHLGKGGRAVFVRRGTIVAAQGNRAVIVGRVRDFPVTFGGRAAHQAENLLHALAACWGYGLPPRRAGMYLRGFAVNHSHNPGRANLYNLGEYQVLVDYGHNADGIARTGELARKLAAGRILAVLGVPGDRCDQLIRESGRAAASCFDFLIIKEDDDLRGRAPGETARLLAEGAARLPSDRIVIVPEESQAVRRALSLARPKDLVVIFYEKLERVTAEVLSRLDSQVNVLVSQDGVLPEKMTDCLSAT